MNINIRREANNQPKWTQRKWEVLKRSLDCFPLAMTDALDRAITSNPRSDGARIREIYDRYQLGSNERYMQFASQAIKMIPDRFLSLHEITRVAALFQAITPDFADKVDIFYNEIISSLSKINPKLLEGEPLSIKTAASMVSCVLHKNTLAFYQRNLQSYFNGELSVADMLLRDDVAGTNYWIKAYCGLDNEPVNYHFDPALNGLKYTCDIAKLEEAIPRLLNEIFSEGKARTASIKFEPDGENKFLRISIVHDGGLMPFSNKHYHPKSWEIIRSKTIEGWGGCNSWRANDRVWPNKDRDQFAEPGDIRKQHYGYIR